jgi:hypothetical protein
MCGCNDKTLLCSFDAGFTFETIILNNLNDNGLLVCCNPYAYIYTQNEKNIGICYDNSGINTILYYLYYDSNNNTFSYHEQNYGLFINNINMTNNYIIIASSHLNGYNIYNNPSGYKTDLDTQNIVRSITGLIILNPFSISCCNDNYIAVQGIDIQTYQYSVYRTSLNNVNDPIIKIPMSYQVSAFKMAYNNVIYDITILNQKLSKTIFNENNTFTRTALQNLDQYPVWISISLNSYNTNNYDTIYVGTSVEFMYYSYNSGITFNTSFISCFLENTKIKILKDDKIVEEYICNLKINDDVIISNGDTRKIIFIGYNYIHKHNIKNIAKIKKHKISDNCPNDDLYLITGHSLLFKSIPEEFKNEYYDKSIYNTTVYDDYKKIITLHTNIYETPSLDELNIIDDKIKYYHLSLENENLDEHYGIYSNNLLTETMTINYISKSNLFPSF